MNLLSFIKNLSAILCVLICNVTQLWFMIQPPFLKPNDVIGIVATARSVSVKDLDYAVSYIQNSGYRVKLGKTIGLVQNQFAGNDYERATDFEQMLIDPSVKAIWCAKGGYGSVRIVDLVDWSLLKRHPKWIVGYSDVTSLHCHVNRLSLMSIHGQMPVGLAEKSDASAEVLFQLLKGDLPGYSVPTHPANKLGKTEARLVGGNLSVLYSLLGSESFPHLEGSILFIEDLDEYLYHIDRMLQNFKRNKLFSSLKGVIVGGMSNMNDNAIPFGKSAEEIIMEYTRELNIPVLFNFPAGHVHDNLPLVFGKNYCLEVTNHGSSLSFI